MGEKKLWTEFQDNCLKYLKEQCKIEKWSEIALKMISDYDIHNRNEKQCRDRYLHCLNPSINSENWCEEDEHMLIECHRKFGNRWTKIAQLFKGRTDSFVKNHFYSRLRKCVRKLNNQIQNCFKKSNKNYKKFNLNIIFKLTNLVQGNFNKISKEVKFYYEELLYKLIKNSIKAQNQLQNEIDDRQQIQTNVLSLIALENLSGLIEGNGKPKRGRGVKKLEKYLITSSGKYLIFNDDGLLEMENQQQLLPKNFYNFQTMENQIERLSDISYSTQEMKEPINEDNQKFYSQNKQNQLCSCRSQRKLSIQTQPESLHHSQNILISEDNNVELKAFDIQFDFDEYKKGQSSCSDLMQYLLESDSLQSRYGLFNILQ